MRRRMEALRDAALRVDPARRVAAHLEREHARDVGLEGQRLQVEHQLDVLVERVGHARGRAGQFAGFARVVAGLDALDAPLDLAHVLEILLHPLAIARVERAVQVGDLGGDVVEHARRGAAARRPFLARTAGAEELIEGHARVADHRQRLGRRRPADHVGVDAGVAVGAAAGLVDVLDAQLHRRDRRVLPEALGVELIDRDAGADIGAFGLARVRLREEHGARAEVIAADLRLRHRLGVAHVGVADDGQVLAEALERAERGRSEIEIVTRPPPATTGAARRPTDCCRPSRAPSRCRPGAGGRATRPWPCRQTGRAPAPSRRGTAAPPWRPGPAASSGAPRAFQ